VAPSVQRRKVRLTPTAGVPCSNAAKMRNGLKFVGVPQTPEQISAASGLTILWRHLEDILLLNKFFSDCWYVPQLRRYSRQSCVMVSRWRFLRPVFSASRVQHVSDLHLKCALRPHHVWKYETSNLRRLRLGKEKKKKKKSEETTG